MIDKLTYDQILTISQELKQQAGVIEKLIEKKDTPELTDFIATVEGYSKFLETSVEIYKDADKALEGLVAQKKGPAKH